MTIKWRNAEINITGNGVQKSHYMSLWRNCGLG